MGDEGVSPIVATLVLIVVAIIGAAAVALIMGSFSSNVSQQANTGNTANSASIQVGIADSLIMRPMDTMIMGQYNTNHTGIYVKSIGGADDTTAITSVGMNIADIGASTTAPNAGQYSKYPNLQTNFIGGRALVLIANPGFTNLTSASTGGVSQGDMLSIYGTTAGNGIPYERLGGLQAVATDTSGDGVSAILANWLTYGASEDLSKMMIFPNGVTSAPQTSESGVINYVATTPNSIGFVDWAILKNSPQAGSVKIVPILNENNGVKQTPSDSNIDNELYSMTNTYYDAGLCKQLFYTTNGNPDSLVQNYINWAESSGMNSGLSSLGFISATDIGTPNLYAGNTQVVLTVGGVGVQTMTFTMEQLQQFPMKWTTFTYTKNNVSTTVSGMGVPLASILSAANVPATYGVLGWGYDNYTTSHPPSGISGLYLDYYTGAGGLNKAGGTIGTAIILPSSYVAPGGLANQTAVCFTKGGGGVAELSLVIPNAKQANYMAQSLGYIEVESLGTSGTDCSAFYPAVTAVCNQDNPTAAKPSPLAAVIDPINLN